MMFPLSVSLNAQTKPPATRAEPVTEIIEGVTLADPYRWLEDQSSPATRTWIEEQTRFTRAALDPLPGRAAIQQRLGELTRVHYVSKPIARGGRYFYEQRAAEKARYSICVRKGPGGAEEVLVDPAAISVDPNTSVGLLDSSADGKLIVYALREGGADETVIHFFDVDQHRLLPGPIPKGRHFASRLTPDGRMFFYTDFTPLGPRVYSHRVGAPSGEDDYLFGEDFSPEFFIDLQLSEPDGRYLIFHVAEGAAANRTDIYIRDLKTEYTVPFLRGLVARSTALIANRTLFLTTNWNAPRSRVFRIDLDRPQRHFWKLIIPESPNNIEATSLYGGKLLIERLVNATSRLELFETDGHPAGEIPLPGRGTAFGAATHWDSGEAFLEYSSFNAPAAVYRYDVTAGSQSLWARPSVPFDGSMIETRQVWYTSKDGTRIPMFVVHRKGLPFDGARPTILSGYGGFSASITPFFSAWFAHWIERGGVFASANLRGGAEFGEQWHRDGMLDKKQNVFDDFIAAAEWLAANRYTSPRHLGIFGGSNGGLLVGAALTQRPELFRAALCAVPLLDMVRYHQFLIASLWVPEYGSSDNPDQFAYLLKYSPYHNVRDGAKYPAVMFQTGDSDTRVAPLHARKMCARLQAASTSGLPILLHYDTESGHSGGLPVEKEIADSTDILSFFAWQLDLEPAAPPPPVVSSPATPAGSSGSTHSPAGKSVPHPARSPR